MVNALSLDDFLELLDRYGSDLTNWQLASTEVDAVADLLAHSPEARKAVMAMRDLEAELRRYAPGALAGLADRVLAAAGLAVAQIQPIIARPRPRRPILN